MNSFLNTIWSSIGKKWVMAITGLSFCGFLVFHLLGNLTVYGGPELFNWYVEHLHSLGILIKIAEWVLLFLFLVHVITGLLLAYENYRARPVRYAVSKTAGGRTLGSRSMAITGILILVFVIFHLLTFRSASQKEVGDLMILTNWFHRPEMVAAYIMAMAVAALHVSHGFWSAFQTLGTGHAGRKSKFKTVGIILSLVVAFGFGCIPVFISMVS
jgi:succinate dehydrogenase / fumarate reductase cytochrome b subunit